MSVHFSNAAEADIEGIGDWIARENPNRAVSFVREIRDACIRIANAPHGYSVIERYKALGIRRKTLGAYLIFYRVERERIDIVRVLHGARDYEAILAPDFE